MLQVFHHAQAMLKLKNPQAALSVLCFRFAHTVQENLHIICFKFSARAVIISEHEVVCNWLLGVSQTLHRSYLFVGARLVLAGVIIARFIFPQYCFLAAVGICWLCFGKVLLTMLFMNS